MLEKFLDDKELYNVSKTLNSKQTFFRLPNFYTNLHELFCQFIIWTNWVNSGKFMGNYWISCQVMADMKNFNETKYTVSGKCLNVSVSCTHLFNSSGPTSTRIFLKLRSNNAMHKIRWLEKKLACKKWKSKYHSTMEACFYTDKDRNDTFRYLPDTVYLGQPYLVPLKFIKIDSLFVRGTGYSFWDRLRKS